MKVLSKVTLFSLLGGLLVFGTGCGQQGLPAGLSPEDVITKALLSRHDISKSVYEMDMSADLKGEVDGEKNDLDGSVSISGTTNTEAEEMSMTMSIDGTMNEESVKADIELRANADGVFAKISNVDVSDADTQEMIDLFLEDYLNQWVKLAFMTPDELIESGYTEIDYDEGDELPFTNIQFKGITDILGLQSYHFTADVDEDQLLSMMEGDVADAEAFLTAAEMTGDIYVAVNEMVMTGFGGTMKLNDPEMNGTIDISIKVNPTKADKVQTPAYETELTEDDIAELMFGGAVPGPGMEFDDSMMDDEMMMEDFDFSEFEDLEGFEDVDPALFELHNLQFQGACIVFQ